MKNTIKIGNRKVGKGHPVFVIAEVGSNHDGSFDRAKELIKLSKDAGADAVKFQSFTAEGLFNPLKPDGDKWVSHPAYKIIESLTLPEDWHYKLKEYADSIGIIFLSAPFDLQRAELLNKIGVPAFKIASGDLTNDVLLKKAAGYKKPVIISTGAAYLGEVERAVDIVKNEGNDEIALLHCVSLYPPKFEDSNIMAMNTMANAFQVPVGYSDHTPGWTVPIAAVALGACIIEKHITISRNLKGPDHPYALEGNEFKTMVDEIRNLEKALGHGIKRPTDNEMGERIGARRSIYAKADIKKGAKITMDMLKLVRHAYGLEPRHFECIIGKSAKRDIKAHEIIKWEDID